MNLWRNKIFSYKSISWLLIAAILFITLLPAHYHLHHLFSADTSHHAHVVDFHLLADKTDQSHHEEGAKVFTATPDGIVKKITPDFFPLILMVALLVLLPVVASRHPVWPRNAESILKRRYQHFSPPLRAPPSY